MVLVIGVFKVLSDPNDTHKLRRNAEELMLNIMNYQPSLDYIKDLIICVNNWVKYLKKHAC